MSVVLDASVFVSAMSPSERQHAQALALMQQVPETEPFLVPSVFRLEIVAAFARRRATLELLDLVDARVRGPRFRVVPVDDEVVELAVRVARTARLRGYDALYAAVALGRNAALMTLDDELAERLRASFPQVRVSTALHG